MIALRFFRIDTSDVSLADIRSHIARTASTNGFTLWRPNGEGLPMGIVQAANAAEQIIQAVVSGRKFLGIPEY